MAIKIMGTPAQWGVDFLSNPHLPPWEHVLDEIKQAGYKGLELGIYGYLPLDSKIISEALEKRSLYVVAATIFDDLISESYFNIIKRQAHDLCGILSKLPIPPSEPGQHFPAPYLVIIDWGHDSRDYGAGHPDTTPRLHKDDWNKLIEHIKCVAKIANEYGIRPVIHNHAGSYIEFEDELSRLLQDIGPEIAGICVDTGHLAYAGINPSEWLRENKERVDYIHFKDIDPVMHKKVLNERIRFFDGCARGVMCPIGQGSVDYSDIYKTLQEINYNGYVTIEQERDPKNADGSLDDAKRSLSYLREAGFVC